MDQVGCAFVTMCMQVTLCAGGANSMLVRILTYKPDLYKHMHCKVAIASECKTFILTLLA